MMQPEEYGDMALALDNDDNDGKTQQLELQQGNDDEVDHDQLPNVEEYKASIGHRSGVGLKEKFKKAIGNIGPSSSSAADGIEETESMMILPRDPVVRKRDPPEIRNQKYEYIDYDAEGHHTVENEGLFKIDSEDEEEEEEERQFQTLEIEEEEEEKYEGDPNKCFWKSCGLISICLLAAVLVQFLVFGQETETPRDFFHFVQGDTDAYFAVKGYVVDIGSVSPQTAFDQTTTPQYLAAQWMAHGDPLNMPIPQERDLQFSERYIMAVLFFAMGGTEWTHQYNFLSGDHICTWFKEFTLRDGSSVLYGVHRCKEADNGELYPHSVFMPNNGLSGFIPDEIKGLEGLEVFNVMFNPNVVGTIPAAFRSMDSLTHLAMQWCNLDGTIPTWIGTMTNLEYLGLGNNLLDGTVPEEIQNLNRLELLGLDDNDLFGNIDMFAPLSNLKSLYLENNFFNGTISETLMQGWPKMEELDLSECAFTGALPPTLFNHCPQLKVLDLHGNGFVGPFPDSIDTNSELDFLALHNNRLEGFVPTSLKNLEALHHLDLSENLFESTLPEALGEMTALEYLFTGTNNFFPGEVPKFLIELTNLKELSMKQNKLQGSIPEFFLYLSNLVFLDFHDNNLSQQIPSGFGKLTTLRHLILKQNALTGQPPAEMGQMTELQVLLMEQNNFEGNADAICSVTSFTVETFVADCGDEFVQESPTESPGGDTGAEENPTTSPSAVPDDTGIVDDDPAGVIVTSPPTPATNPDGSPTADFTPTIAAFQVPTPFDDDKVFTPAPTASPPAFDDDQVNTSPPAGNDVGDGGGDGGDGRRRRMVGGQIGCSCCTICCDPGDAKCNNWDWKGNLDPIWEHGYKRRRYSYDLGPVVWLP
mmetsp:Transcript_36742/g.89155  ORF Transcript_36742/g.89155 Transcript_36742/m.89155 type:complete len:871 (-) Transcript_36742:512-3124(-)